LTWRHRCIGGQWAQTVAIEVQTPARRCAEFVRAIVPTWMPEAVIQKHIDDVMATFGYTSGV